MLGTGTRRGARRGGGGLAGPPIPGLGVRNGVSDIQGRSLQFGHFQVSKDFDQKRCGRRRFFLCGRGGGRGVGGCSAHPPSSLPSPRGSNRGGKALPEPWVPMLLCHQSSRCSPQLHTQDRRPSASSAGGGGPQGKRSFFNRNFPPQKRLFWSGLNTAKSAPPRAGRVGDFEGAELFPQPPPPPPPHV